MVEGIIDGHSEERVLFLLPHVELVLQILLLHLRQSQLAIPRVGNGLQLGIGVLGVPLDLVVREDDELAVSVLEDVDFDFK